MSNKLYVIIGRSGVGKSTLQKMMGNIGFIEVVSHTTRQKRKSEIEGVDYHFIDFEEFNRMLESDEVLEFAEYNSWMYCTSKKSIDLDRGNHVIVTNPEGFIQLRDKLGEDKVVGIYLYVTDTWELLKRSIDREPHASHEKCKEICRRFVSDDVTFKDIDKIKGIPLKVNNLNVRDTLDIVLRNIKNGI